MVINGQERNVKPSLPSNEKHDIKPDVCNQESKKILSDMLEKIILSDTLNIFGSF